MANNKLPVLCGNYGHSRHTDNRSDLLWKFLHSVSLRDSFNICPYVFPFGFLTPIKVINAGGSSDGWKTEGLSTYNY